eukprot:48528-Lingulodinium_polyedra.AAC.1
MRHSERPAAAIRCAPVHRPLWPVMRRAGTPPAARESSTRARTTAAFTGKPPEADGQRGAPPPKGPAG